MRFQRFSLLLSFLVLLPLSQGFGCVMFENDFTAKELLERRMQQKRCLMERYFDEDQSAYMIEKSRDERIQKEFASLLISQGCQIPLPDFLNIHKVAHLMDQTLKQENQERDREIRDFFVGFQNHRNNTPPYFLTPDDMPAPLREGMFQRLLGGLRAETENRAKDRDTRESLLQEGKMADLIYLENLATRNYKILTSEIFQQFGILASQFGWFEQLIRSISRLSTVEGMQSTIQWEKITLSPKTDFVDRRGMELSGKAGLRKSSRAVQGYKELYPFAYLLNKLLPSKVSFIQSIRDFMLEVEQGYIRSTNTFYAFQINFAYYDDLIQDPNLIDAETQKLNTRGAALLQDHITQTQCAVDRVLGMAREFLLSEYAAIDQEIDAYYNAVLQAREFEKKARRQKQRENYRQNMAQAAKLSQELHKTAQEKTTSQTSTPQSNEDDSPSKPQTKQHATNEGAYTTWYWASLKDFNLKKESRQAAKNALLRDHEIAQRKASKNHKVDPAKVATSNVLETPASQDVEQIVLGANHFKTYDLLMHNKNCECDLEDLTNVVEALGGHVDPYRKGSCVAGYVRHIDSGKVIPFSFHYHSKNGRKNVLRPEEVGAIQNVLIEAGYTFARVLCKVGSAYDNTISSAVSSTSSTSSTSLTATSSSEDK